MDVAMMIAVTKKERSREVTVKMTGEVDFNTGNSLHFHSV
jgi:hypothetical protein